MQCESDPLSLRFVAKPIPKHRAGAAAEKQDAGAAGAPDAEDAADALITFTFRPEDVLGRQVQGFHMLALHPMAPNFSEDFISLTFRRRRIVCGSRRPSAWRSQVCPTTGRKVPHQRWGS